MQLTPLTLACALVLCLAAPTIAAEPSQLEGTWIEVLSEQPRVGYSLPRDPVTLVISGNSLVNKVGDRPFRQSLFKPGAGHSPKAIDLMTVVGDEFWLTRAIYKVDGDVLTICESARDKPRPTTFRPWTGIEDEVTLLTVYRRQPAPAKVKTGQ
jgi:uncharacterized protein (TIGR03067 family)